MMPLGAGRRAAPPSTPTAAAARPSLLLGRHRLSSTRAAAEPAADAPTTSSNDNPEQEQEPTPGLGPHAAPATPPQIVSPRREAKEAAADYAAVYDRLIALFEGRPREDWKKLVVFSAQWPQHRSGVFERLKSRADAEADVDKRVSLRRVYRQLQGVDQEVSRYNSCLQRFLDAEEHEWEAVVAQHRGDLQRAFFEHLQCLIVAAAREEEQQAGGGGGGGGGAQGGGGGTNAVQAAAEAVKAAAERAKRAQEAEAAAAIGGTSATAGKGFGSGGKKSGGGPARPSSASATATSTPAETTTDPSTKKERLIAVNARLLALVANHDSVAADTQSLEKAAEAYRDVLNSAKSVEDVDRAVEKLAQQGKIDPAFLQISARAYGAARDTEMTLDEAKWVAYRMYVKARDYFDRQQPQEKRILEYLVTIRDRTERSRLLDQAVTPGPVRGTDSHDYLYSTPPRLYKVLDGTLKAWEAVQRGAEKRMGVSERASTPRRVVAMRELRDEIRRRYL
jgi:tetratricopeptide (TPR) repeat protein